MSFPDHLLRRECLDSAPLRRFARMIAPEALPELESLAAEARRITFRHFGRTMRLFAPVYLSNECVNNCRYCGFSRDNPILRTTLSVDQLVEEAKHLHGLGLRNILLVAGEHPRFVSEGYIQECLDRLKSFIPTLVLEIGPMEDDQYREIVSHGAEGLVVYQETYDEATYAHLHTAGPKKDYRWRMQCPERAYAAGFRRIGLGVLFGLADWRQEALALAAHLDYLQRRCWRANYTVSFPRLRPHAGDENFQPDSKFSLDDRSFVQLLTAFRICFPQVGVVLSTRETPAFRDAVMPLGITHLSAGSQTDPGGYTGCAPADLHRTLRGRRVELTPEERLKSHNATQQFETADHRSPEEIAALLQKMGVEPVWKDWEECLLAPTA